MSKNYCSANHNDKVCFLTKCRYHSIFRGYIEDLPQNLHAFCYLHVDCLYTLFKYRFSHTIVVKGGQVFVKVRRAVSFNQGIKGVERVPSIEKRRPMRRNSTHEERKHLLSSFQNTKSTQISWSVFAEKIDDGFLYGYGTYTRSLVTYNIKSL